MKIPNPAWESGEPLVIGIAGGSGSGKTTVAHALVEGVDRNSVAFIEHDSYYHNLNHLSLEERRRVNFDHPDSLETSLLVEHLKQLRAGNAVHVPVYDFTNHTRLEETVTVPPLPVIVVDGILVLAEPELRAEMGLKIFVDTDADIRLLRRIERDVQERGRSMESVMKQYRESVRPMHLLFVQPSRRYADIVIPEGYNEGAVGAVNSLVALFLAARASA